MAPKLTVTIFAGFLFGVLSAAHLNAGTDMIIDNSAQAPPPPVYVSAPPPPVIYYAPRPAIVVAPAYAYRVRPARVYAYRSWHDRRVHGPIHPWR